MKRFVAAVGGLVMLLTLSLVPVGPVEAAPPPDFDQAEFDRPLDIDNSYMPLEPGTTFIYEGKADGETFYETFVVTDETKTILGIKARVVRDTVWENGELVELTEDWFAQDDAGNVWYLGEFSTDYQNGKVVGHEGSWQAGVKGAEPGIVMLANPKVGDSYAQEVAPGVAEDKATVLKLNETLRVPHGRFTNVLVIKEFTPLEPGVVEHKYYAPGVGQIKTQMVKGGNEVSRLKDVKKEGKKED
ncbi:MAG: hypothetical protein HY782_20500 [Chloroflexi bacterium]|nr:hypothetical protein [Chloroflexota bacterium]